MSQKVAIDAEKTRSDYPLMAAVIALIFFGIVMVYSSTYAVSYEYFDDPNHFIQRHLIWLVLGTIFMVGAMQVDYHNLRRVSIPMMVFNLAVLLLLLVFGDDVNGARRWFFGGSIQPSEICKLAVIIYIADWLSSKGKRIQQVTYGLIPFAILIGVITGLILMQPDFSTALLVVFTTVAMFFVAGADIIQLIIGSTFASATLVFLITRSPYRLERIASFVAALTDPFQSSYQVQQAVLALGSGGMTGLGLGASRQKYGYLPVPHSDSVFAVLGEELGLIGCLTVLGLFALLVYRGFKISLNTPDSFGTLLAVGITCWLGAQALFNIAAITSTIPFTGITLPFISYGGSSLVFSMIAVGILLNISRASRVVGRLANENYDLRRRHRRAHLSRVGSR